MIFATFEGIDGSGKSTQAQLLVERLTEAGHAVRLFREPGGTVLSERIRSLLLDPSLHIRALPELLLFSSARAQLVYDEIRPALEEGIIVICDRFYDSTTAYQGAGRQVADLQWIRDLNVRVTGGLKPHRTYLIELGPDEALCRRRTRPAAEAADDRIERADRQFYRRIIDAYARLADEEPRRIMRLDGTQSIEELSEVIWTDFRDLLQNRQGTASSA